MSTLWTPAEITTALWLDADDSSTITLVSSAVSEWRDKSGNTRHAEQTTPARRPSVATASINGRNSIQFTEADEEWMQADYGSLLAQPNDVYIVATYESPGTRSYFFDGTDTSNRNALGRGINADDGRFYLFSGEATAARISGDVVSIPIPATIWNGRFNTTASQVFKNGTSYLAGNLSAAQGANGITIGAARLGAFGFLTGKVAEVIVLNGLATTEERQLLEGYLAHKWGLAANLPAGHPYKSAAPTLPGFVGNARVNATTAARVVIAFDTNMVELARTVPDPSSTPPGDYTISETGVVYLQAHAFDPAKWRGIWQADTVYEEGDIVFTEASGEGLVVECTTAGVSQATAWTTLGTVNDLAPKTNFYVAQ